MVFVDKADIDKTGLSAVADVLQRLPSASGGLNTKVNNSGNLGNPPDGGGVGAGSATIDLRYLGANRTLVLVDGLRFVNGTSASGIPGAVDLNTIPINMIDRVEVLQAGASPLYGSDAIAGVVNIITVAAAEGAHGFGAVRDVPPGRRPDPGLTRRATDLGCRSTQHRLRREPIRSRSRSSRATGRSRNSRTRSRLRAPTAAADAAARRSMAAS